MWGRAKTVEAKICYLISLWKYMYYHLFSFIIDHQSKLTCFYNLGPFKTVFVTALSSIQFRYDFTQLFLNTVLYEFSEVHIAWLDERRPGGWGFSSWDIWQRRASRTHQVAKWRSKFTDKGCNPERDACSRTRTSSACAGSCPCPTQTSTSITSFWPWQKRRWQPWQQQPGE